MFNGNTSMTILFGVKNTNGYQFFLAASLIALEDCSEMGKNYCYYFKIN